MSSTDDVMADDFYYVYGVGNNINNNSTNSSLVYFHVNDDEDPHAVSTFEFVTNGILLTSTACLGIVGNVVSIVVLSRPQMHSSINCCLIGLASFDTVVLLVGILMCGLKALPHNNDYLRTYYPHIMPVFYPLGLIAQTGSVWITVSVTIERFIAVCHPLRAKSLCTYRRARAYILLISLFAFCYNLPRFWELEKVTVFDPFTNASEVRVVPSELRTNDTYITVYLLWMYLFVMYFVPFLTLAVLNGLIWRQVREANRERQRLSRLQKKEISLAIMLLVVVVVFFICNILALVVSILEACQVYVDALTNTGNFLVTVNSSVNFIIYCIFGQKFRRILIRMFCRFGSKRSEEQLEESVYPMPSVNTTETKPLCSNGISLSVYPSRQTNS